MISYNVILNQDIPGSHDKTSINNSPYRAPSTFLEGVWGGFRSKYLGPFEEVRLEP